jgi:threonine dehydrogenase-like Zn-dependent dehydrogenase
MRAVAVFPGSRAIRIVDHPDPRLERDTEVKVRILEVGVCGTDREIARFDYGAPPPDADYLVLGHEALGRVIDTGEAVTRLRPGDLVVPMVRRPCPHRWCRACTRDRSDFCFSGDYRERGIKELHGYMTERVVEAQRYLHLVPADLRDLAVLVEPLTIAEKALTQVWDVQKRLPWTASGCADGTRHGEKAVVLGAGPVGLLGALALLARGFETWVYSRDGQESEKARWVESVGGRYLSVTTTTLDELAARVGNIDLIYEATGASSLAFAALAVLGINGVYVFTGVPGRKGPISIDADGLMRKLVLQNQLVFGTVSASPAAFHAAIVDLARFRDRWPVETRALVSGRHPPEAYAELLRGRPPGIKHVLCFAEG